MESATLLLSGQEGGILPLRVAAFPVGVDGDRLRLAVWAEVESSELESADSGRHLELAVYALAGAEVRASQLQEFRIPSGPIPAAIRLAVELPLAPGTYSLRVLLRDRTAAEVGLRVLAIDIPAAGASGLFPPLLGAEPAAEPWTLRAGSAPTATAPPARAAPRSLSRADGAQPLLLPVWRAGTATGFELQARRPGDPSGQPVQFRNPAEGPVLDGAVSELSFWRGELPVPELALGEHELAPAGGAPLLRLQVSEQRTRSPRPAAAAARPRGSGRGGAAAAARAYRRALEALAADPAGGLEPAAAILAEFEPAALASGSLDPDQLLAAEIGVAEALAEAAPDALLPAIALHLDLYAARHRTRDPGATTHAREMVVRLTDLYAARGGDRAVAAEAMLSMASLFDETSPTFQRRMLIKAADFDPGTSTAWRALAVSAERSGDFSRADYYARRLLESEPDSAEATLRLGVYAIRSGQPKAALRHLRAVSQAAHAAPALRLVAAQETSRAHFESGDLAHAAEAARAGLALEPEDEKLRLLLAAALDGQGRRSEAAELLAAVAPSREPNARWTLTRPPTAALLASAERFAERTPAAVPALARALGEVARP